jgi:hypothetical protein
MRERLPAIAPAIVVVCAASEAGRLDGAGELCVVHEEAVLLESVMAGVVGGAVAVVSWVGATFVSVKVLLVERWLFVREDVELEGMVLGLGVWVFFVDGLGAAVNVVGAAGTVISEATTSDIVMVSVNDLMTRDTVTVKVVECSLVISAVDA